MLRYFQTIGGMTMTTGNSDWLRMRFKRNKVWVAVDSDGKIRNHNGKALIKYQKEQDYEYRVRETDLLPLDAEPGDATAKPRRKPEQTRKTIRPIALPDAEDPNCIRIYADGASSGNPGPSGIGVLLRYREHEKEISRNIGLGTNNIPQWRLHRALKWKTRCGPRARRCRACRHNAAQRGFGLRV